jgi:hypothetical protein
VIDSLEHRLSACPSLVRQALSLSLVDLTD